MTVFQKQCLLAYLGYYDGQIDGKWGPLTQAATEAFQKDYQLSVDGVYGDGTHAKAAEIIASKEQSVIQQKREAAGLAPGGPQVEPEDKPVAIPAGDWPDCPNFIRAEFACKCGCGFDDVAHELVQICQKTRDHFDAPFIPTSGCRCKAHNARVGGVYNSRHMACGDGKGHAVDFYIPRHSAAQVDAFVATLPGVVYHYMIDGDCVHMDIGG